MELIDLKVFLHNNMNFEKKYGEYAHLNYIIILNNLSKIILKFTECKKKEKNDKKLTNKKRYTILAFRNILR